MNDPWLPMIAALTGKRTTTPTTWPVRQVYRIDRCFPGARAEPGRGARQLGNDPGRSRMLE